MADAGDVIVVGVGLAGGAAALALARADRHPILVDPGDGSWAPPAGAGILGPRDIPPEVRPSFPVDRRLSDRRLLFLGASSSVSIDYQEGPGAGWGSRPRPSGPGRPRGSRAPRWRPAPTGGRARSTASCSTADASWV